MMPSLRERVVRFGPDDGLAGIITTRRTSHSDALPCVVIINAGIIHRVGPNRLYVDLARTIASHGFTVLRFDLAGLGDSAPMSGAMSLDESALNDVQHAIGFLAASRGATRFLLVGLCSGANYGIRTAFTDPRVTGVIAIDPTVARTRRSTMLHFVRRLKHMATLRSLVTLRHPIFQRAFGGRLTIAAARAAAGQSEQRVALTSASRLTLAAISAALSQSLDRGTQLMLIFTGGVNHVYNYQAQLFDLLPDVDFRQLLTLHYMPETDHTVSDVGSRRVLMASVTNWLRAVYPETRETSAEPVVVASEQPS